MHFFAYFDYNLIIFIIHLSFETRSKHVFILLQFYMIIRSVLISKNKFEYELSTTRSAIEISMSFNLSEFKNKKIGERGESY